LHVWWGPRHNHW